MITIQSLLDSNNLQKVVTKIVKSELGEDKEVVVQTRNKDTRVEFFVITSIGNLNFNMSLSCELDYLDYFITTELQDEQGKQDLKLAYESMCDCCFSEIAKKMRRQKNRESRLKLLQGMDSLMLDVFINSKYGKLLKPKEMYTDR